MVICEVPQDLDGTPVLAAMDPALAVAVLRALPPGDLRDGFLHSLSMTLADLPSPGGKTLCGARFLSQAALHPCYRRWGHAGLHAHHGQDGLEAVWLDAECARRSERFRTPADVVAFALRDGLDRRRARAILAERGLGPSARGWRLDVAADDIDRVLFYEDRPGLPRRYEAPRARPIRWSAVPVARPDAAGILGSSSEAPLTGIPLARVRFDRLRNDERQRRWPMPTDPLTHF